MYAVFKVQIAFSPSNLTANSLNIKLKPSLWAQLKLNGLSGLEPPTSRLSGVRSNQLSYKPIPEAAELLLSSDMEMKRFELSTPCLQGRCSPN